MCRTRVDRLALFGAEGSVYTLAFDREHEPETFRDVRRAWRSFLYRPMTPLSGCAWTLALLFLSAEVIARGDKAAPALPASGLRLNLCRGDLVDYPDVEAAILDAAGRYRLEMLGVDPYLSRTITAGLSASFQARKIKTQIVEIPQTMLGMSPAMRWIREGMYARTLLVGEANRPPEDVAEKIRQGKFSF